jgi:site-specific recombinase XerD
MSYEQCWRLIHRYALAADVQVLDGERLRPANGRAFCHGVAVNLVRQGVPLREVQQQLGHARIDSTSVYAKLANPERRALADRLDW